MSLPRTLLVLALATASLTAAAQQGGGLRWPGMSRGPLGLSVTADTVPYGSSLSIVGKAAIGPELAMYGRVGSLYNRPWTPPGNGPLDLGDGGYRLTYGVGVSWDFTPRLSATLGWDSYDIRTVGGEREPVRFTNIGLQWRY